MESGMKKYSLYILIALLLLSIGTYGGYEIAARYFKATKAMELAISKAYQAYTYAFLFGQNNDIKAKQIILSDLQLNLIRLQGMKLDFPPSLNAHICNQVKDIATNKSVILEFAKQVDDDKSKVRLSKRIDEFEQCESW